MENSWACVQVMSFLQNKVQSRRNTARDYAQPKIGTVNEYVMNDTSPPAGPGSENMSNVDKMNNTQVQLQT